MDTVETVGRPGRRHVLAAVAMVIASSCSIINDQGPTLSLGAIYPLAGRQGPGGIDEEHGTRLAVELVNRRGGVQGRQVRLQVLDVEIGSAAPRAMERLKAAGIEVVLGSYGSTISAPASVAAHHNGMLLWETGAVGQTADDAGAGTNFFRIAPSGSTRGRSGVAFVRDQLTPLLPATPRRYAVAYVDDAYGRAVGLGAVDEVRAMGAELAGAFPYAIKGFDAGELVARIAESRPDVLFVSAYLDDGIALRRATIEAKMPLLASVGTSSSYCMPSFAAALGAAAVGLFASDKPDAAQVREDALSPEGRESLLWARDLYQKRFHEPMSAAALAGFANTWALVGHVLPAAPSMSAAQVAATARAMKLAPGTLANGGGLDLSPPGARDAGENRAAVSVIWQWVAERTQAVVYPPAFATRPLRAVPIQTQ